MGLRFVEEAGIWEVPGPERPCAWCERPATSTYVSELAWALSGPGQLSFCDIFCWGQHIDTNLVVHRSPTPPILPGLAVPDWSQLAAEHPTTGDRGFTTVVNRNLVTILYRLEGGRLAGVLRNTFVSGKPGPIVVVVDPELRGQRIGVLLVRESARRWGHDFHAQTYTPAGYGLEEHAVRRSPAKPPDLG